MKMGNGIPYSVERHDGYVHVTPCFERGVAR
jgi:hypothetical protein